MHTSSYLQPTARQRIMRSKFESTMMMCPAAMSGYDCAADQVAFSLHTSPEECARKLRAIFL